MSVFDYVVPGVSFVLMSVLYFVWTQFSPSDIIEREPRVFFFSLGVVYSNMAVSFCLFVCFREGKREGGREGGRGREISPINRLYIQWNLS